MKRKRSIAFVLALVMCLALASCGSSSSSESSQSSVTSSGSSGETAEEVTAVSGVSDETLYVATEGEPNSLCPQYSGGNVNGRVDVQIYDTLVEYDYDTQTSSPSVATEWEWVDDTHLSITLRDDVYFTNGDQLTAEDVLFSMEQGQLGSLSTYYTMIDIENSEIVDDQHLILAFQTPCPQFMDIVGSTHYALLSKQSYEDVGEDISALALAPVGSGKFSLYEWKTGESITLVRNDDYWNQDELPYYKYITFYFISDSASRVASLESGQVQVAFGIDKTSVDEVNNFDGLTTAIVNQSTANSIMFNYANEALQDIRVRTAIAMVVQPEAFMQVVNNGYGDTFPTIFTPSCSLYVDEEMPEYDVEAAKQLMEEAGYGDGLTLTIAGSEQSQKSSELLQAQLDQIGITLDIQNYEMASFLDALFTGNFDIIISEADNWNPALALVAVDSRNGYATAIGGSLYQGEGEDELHDLIDAANSEMDETARAEIYAEIQDFLAENVVAIGLYSSCRVEGISDQLTGITYDVRGYPCLSDVRPIA